MKKNEKIILGILVGIFLLMILFLGFLKIKERFLKKNTVYIYFPNQKIEEHKLVPIEREISYYGDITKKVKETIEQLIEGPNIDEKQNGFFTCIPPETRILNINLDKGNRILYIDFSKEIEQGGGTLSMETRIAQIVYTATQFPEVESVRFLIEGKMVDYFSGEGITIVEHPIKREHLKEFEVSTKEEIK